MSERNASAGGQGRKAPTPPRHTSGTGPFGPASASRSGGSLDPSIDPELVEDLGAELEFRGDQIDAELAAVRGELEAARAETEAANAESAVCRDQALRAQAEFENFRKRITREREEERQRASERLVAETLPVIDNLERAIEHTTAGGDLKDLLTGVEAVHAQLVGVLGKEGVVVIDPFGQPFDPMTQQAVSQKEDAEVPEGTVIEVFQKGYSLGGRVIRSAMVVVSTGGPSPEE